jgi:hypothetical protein
LPYTNRKSGRRERSPGEAWAAGFSSHGDLG